MGQSTWAVSQFWNDGHSETKTGTTGLRSAGAGIGPGPARSEPFLAEKAADNRVWESSLTSPSRSRKPSKEPDLDPSLLLERTPGVVCHDKGWTGTDRCFFKLDKFCAKTGISTRATTSPFFSPSASSTAGHAHASGTEQGRAPSTPFTTGMKCRPPRGTTSSLPIPPLSAQRFGLIQEELAHDHFRLLIAVTFLVRTKGTAAIPVFHRVMQRFPTPAALAAADGEDIIPTIHHLGLSAVRYAVIQRYAHMWQTQPPIRTVRHAVKNYPNQDDGAHMAAADVFGPEYANQDTDAISGAIGCAWEIGHLTQGRYALDSWRIFCRDILLGRAQDCTGKGSADGFQPEWMRVLPTDKELRACLRWMWMRDGWEWDFRTGEIEVLREEMRRAVDEGRVGYDEMGALVILEE